MRWWRRRRDERVPSCGGERQCDDPRDRAASVDRRKTAAAGAVSGAVVRGGVSAAAAGAAAVRAERLESDRNINVTPDFIQAFINVNTDPNVVIKDAVEMLQDTACSLKGLDFLEKVKKIINSNPLRSEADNEKIRNLLYQAENELMPITKKARIKTFDEVEQSYLENFEARKNGKQYKFGDRKSVV